MATLNVVVVYAGSPYRDALGNIQHSDIGHMFFELNGQTGQANESWGFEPEGVIPGEAADYFQRDYTATFEITDQQAQAIRDYAMARENDSAHQFPPWDPITNSCVDFVWGAMEAGGIEPASGADLFPGWNVDDLEQTMYDYQHRFDPTLWERIYKIFDDFRKQSSSHFFDAQTYQSSGIQGRLSYQCLRDPLVFDLDGDGIETIGVDSDRPILFDHDGDGIKTATGWVGSDDGFLVMDRNGNGTIDNGSELFGDSTPSYTGGNAVDGFAALAQEDTNQDGKVDANDARFDSLKIWRDLNQDGVSQSEELFSLNSLGIESINVANIERPHELVVAFGDNGDGNGNFSTGTSTFTRTDGTTAAVGNLVGEFDLVENGFFSQFPDAIPVTPEAAALPNMGGSGMVRSMHEAASLSPTLVSQLTTYLAATTREEQLAALDALIQAWSDTSSMATTSTGAYAGHTLTITFSGVETGSAEYLAWLNKLTILERFNGTTFQPVPTGTDPVWVFISSAQMELLDQSYDALRDSVYQSLLPQTRLEPLLDQISVKLYSTGIKLDFTAVEDGLTALITANTRDGLTDVLHFVNATQSLAPLLRHADESLHER